MKNISLMAAFAAFMLAGCNHENEVKFAFDDGVRVTFSALINDQNAENVSRVSGINWDDGDIVSISCGPTQQNVSYKYNAGDGSFNSVEKLDAVWLMGTEEYDVTAYYPPMGEPGVTPPLQNVKITSENQGDAEEREKFDFLYAATKATKKEPNVQLNFNHVMSRVNLKFVPGTDPDGNPVKLNEIECYLVGIKCEGTFDTTAGVATASEDAPETDLRQMLNQDNKYTFTVYLLPQIIGEDGIEIEAAMKTEDGRRIYYYLNIPTEDWAELKPGYSYNYTLTANDYKTSEPTLLEISTSDINQWTEIKKEETPECKALGTEADANASVWGEMENEEIIPVEKQ